MFDIPTIYQRLYQRGVELTDNKSTVQELQIFHGDILDLCEIAPEDEFDTDVDVVDDPPKRDEGRAFGGTLLSRGSLVTQATQAQAEGTETSRSNSEHVEDDAEAAAPMEDTQEVPMESLEVQCPACTFANSADSSCCTMCGTSF